MTPFLITEVLHLSSVDLSKNPAGSLWTCTALFSSLLAVIYTPQHHGHLFGYLHEKDISSYMADVYYLKVIAIVNRSSSEGPSGHTN